MAYPYPFSNGNAKYQKKQLIYRLDAIFREKRVVFQFIHPKLKLPVKNAMFALTGSYQIMYLDQQNHFNRELKRQLLKLFVIFLPQQPFVRMICREYSNTIPNYKNLSNQV